MNRWPFLISCFGFLCLFNSCVEEQNFDQYDEVSILPVMEAALLYVETPEDLINQGPAPDFIDETFTFTAFSEPFIAERLEEGVLIYQLENTTSKPLSISIEFVDAAGNTLDTETFLMDPAPTAVLNREVAYGLGGKPLDRLFNTASLRVLGTNLGDTSSVSGAPNPQIVLRTTAKFGVRLK